MNNEQWFVALNSPRRLTTSIDDFEAPTKFQCSYDNNPNLRLFIDNLDEILWPFSRIDVKYNIKFKG